MEHPVFQQLVKNASDCEAAAKRYDIAGEADLARLVQGLANDMWRAAITAPFPVFIGGIAQQDHSGSLNG